MNIYQRQMQDLGLNIDQYSQMLDIPKSITKKIVNGNGEVIKNNMEINNFLRKNLFNKHQEVENSKEEKKMEAMAMKLEEKNQDPKIIKLLEEHPDSKALLWYINDYDKDEYFKKYNIKSKYDLMERYNFSCNVGRLKHQKSVGESTIDRLVNKSYSELGSKSAYPLICQLYECLELGSIEDSKPKTNSKKGVKGFQKKEYTEEEQKLRDWFIKFDLAKFIKEKSMSYKMFAEQTGVAYKSIYAVKSKRYIPTCDIIQRIKDFTEKFETRIIPDERTATVNEESIMTPFESVTVVTTNVNDIQIDNNEDVLRNLLKDRLTEEEKTLIRIFGGKI